jgi:hypothetical protein
MNNISFLSVLPQRNQSSSAMPVLIPKVAPIQNTPSITPVLMPKSTSEQKPDYKPKPKGKKEVPAHHAHLSTAPKPSPEQQLETIIRDKPSKQAVAEYLQHRCNDLTILKVK